MKIIKRALVASVALLLVGFAISFSPSKPLSMIEDLNLVDVNTPVNGYSKTVYFDGYLYFVSNDYETGSELWRSDGVTAELVKDAVLGQDSPYNIELYKKGNYLYVSMNSSTNGLAFYSIASGESELVEIETNITYADRKKQINNNLYFIGNTTSGLDIFTFDAGGVQQVTNNSEYSNVYISDYTLYKNGAYITGEFNGQPGVNEYKEGKNYLIDSGKDSYGALHVSDDALYFESMNYTQSKREFYKFNDISMFTFAGELSQYGNDIAVYGENLAIYSAATGENVSQIYVTSGSGFQQITNFLENEYLDVDFIGVAKGALNYTITGRSSAASQLFQLNGTTATEIPLEFDSLKKNYPQPTASVSKGKLFFWVYKGSNRHLYALDGLTLTELYSENSYGVSKPTQTQDNIYYVLSNPNGNKDILEVDVDTKSSTIISSIDESGVNILSADEKIFVSVTRYPDVLGVVDLDAVSLVKTEGVTGSSNPYEFKELEGNTYYLTTSDSGDKSLWVSDGYTTSLVKSFDSNGAQEYDLYRTDRELIVYAEYGNKLWSVKDSEITLIGAFESLLRDPKVGDGFFFIGTEEGGANSALWHYDDGELKEVDSDVHPNFKVVNDGIMYSKPGEEFYLYDGTTSSRLKTNGIDIYTLNDVYSVTQGDYIKDEYGPTPKVVFFDKDKGLRKLNIDFSVYEGVEIYKLTDEILISLRKEVNYNYEYDFYRVTSDVAEKIDTPFMSDSFYVLGAHNNYLYLNGDTSTGSKPYYYWKGAFYEFGWRLGNIKFETRSLELEQNWVIGYNDSENSYFVLSNNGADVEFITKVNSSSRRPRIDETISASGGVFLKFTGNEIKEHELFYLSKEGEVSSLNDNKGFLWGNGSFRENSLGKGHGKWFFMRGCTSEYGCEPYSMNLNQLPAAKFDSEPSYYSGQEVTLDASVTEDPDGNILEYNWVQLSGPEIDFDVTEGEAISFKAPEVDSTQEVVIELTVVDDGYDKDTTSKSVKIKPNSAPEISIVAPQSADEGSTVTLDASGTVDNEGEELSFVWSVDTGGVTLSKRTEAVTSFEVPSLSADTIATLTLTVTDASGYQSAQSIDIQLLNKASEDNNNDDSGSDGGSGGGSTGMFLLMLLSLAYLRRVSIR